MPQMEINDLHQFAVYQAANGSDTYGNKKVDAAIEICVRWETKRKEVQDGEGNTIVLESNVVVNQELKIGSTLWLGQLTDYPSPPTDLQQVVTYTEIPDVKNRISRRVAGLIKLSDTLPDLA